MEMQIKSLAMKAVWYSGSMFISIAYCCVYITKILRSTCHLANLTSGQPTILWQCWFKSHDGCRCCTGTDRIQTVTTCANQRSSNGFTEPSHRLETTNMPRTRLPPSVSDLRKISINIRAAKSLLSLQITPTNLFCFNLLSWSYYSFVLCFADFRSLC